MKHLVRIICLTCLWMSPAVIFAQDETSGTTITYQVQPVSCGYSQGSYINCYGIPFNQNGSPAGSMWLYTNFNAYTQQPYGWGYFYGANDMAGQEFQITSSVFPPAPRNLPATGTFTAQISGNTPDDGGAYSAQVNLNVYYYLSCAHGCRSVMNVTGGTVTVTFQ